MKTFFPVLMLTAFVAIFTSCKTPDKATPPPPPIVDMHNSANSIDWPGTYTGILPCADCDGIATTLVLNADLSYELQTIYSGKSSEVYSNRGKFQWNESGSIITLEGVEDRPKQFKVGENKVIQLNMEGNPITGSLADKYVMMKQLPAMTDATLTAYRWKLVELQGQPVSVAENGKVPYIEFQDSESKVNGFAGCNNFFGSFEIKEGSRITFSKMASTMMACPDMTTEQKLMKVIEMADNYNVIGDKLQLNKARMAPLAKFEKVDKE